MDLATAGLLGGFGEGAAQAAGLGLQYLFQNERMKFDADRDARHERLAAEREQRGYAHEDSKTKADQEFQAGQNQTKMGYDISKSSREDQAKADEAGKDRVLKEREVSTAERNAASLDKYRSALAGKAGAGRGVNPMKDLSATDEALYKAHLEEAKQFHDLAKSPNVFDKAERDGYIARADKSMAKARAIVGGPEIPADGGVVDPFGGGDSKVPAAAGVTSTPSASTSPSPREPQDTQTVEPKRPISPRGGSTPKAQLDKISKGQMQYDLQAAQSKLANAKVHGSKQMVKKIEDEIARLEAQLEGPKGLLATAGQP